MSERININKVGLIGTGMVGASFAYSLMQQGLVNELVLIDANAARAKGEMMDLNHGMPFVRPMRIIAGDYVDLADADVIVICAGVSQRPGQTRLELLQTNAGIFRQIIPQIIAVNQDAIIVVDTNPVDILTHISAEIVGLKHHRVLGSGTVLDTARLRYLLSQHYGVDSRSVHAYIVGEHGDSELALWSLANIAGVRLPDFVGADGQGYDQVALNQIFDQTRNAAYEIIQRKKATYYAIGLGVLAIVEAIIRDQHTVMTKMLIRSGIILIKYWFSVSDEEQERGFQARIDDPTKRWKLSPMDLESRSKWVEYSRAKDTMFAYTDVKQSPWNVVNADDKKRARLNAIAHLLSKIPYKDLTPEQIKLPPRQDDKGYVRPPLMDQTFVPEAY